jgi:hypothetical protein|tara:strand:- start:976 stop:1509 length:534 start_codon:yes stop_codon:yes gene_type:complete
MAYTFDDNKAGLLQIAVTDAGVTMANGTSAIPTPPAVLGQVERAFDPTYGAGEFILLVGVAGTTIGSLVTYDGTTYQTTLAATTSNQARPVAVAMSANLAGSFGWYQIEGTAVCAKSTSSNFAATVAVGVKSTGKVGATGSGKEILGARTANAATVASATTTVNVVMNRPHLQGRIT